MPLSPAARQKIAIILAERAKKSGAPRYKKPDSSGNSTKLAKLSTSPTLLTIPSIPSIPSIPTIASMSATPPESTMFKQLKKKVGKF